MTPRRALGLQYVAARLAAEARKSRSTSERTYRRLLEQADLILLEVEARS